MKKYLVLLAVFLSSALFSAETKLDSGKWTKSIDVAAGEYTGKISIYVPSGVKPGDEKMTLILLHDYNGSAEDWASNSAFPRIAEDKKIILVALNMKNTAYENEFFPETKVKWSPVPGVKWIGEYVVPFISRQYGLCSSRDKTGIAGVGAGARGAFLAASRYSSKIKYVAGFSGIYDNLTLTRNAGLTNLFGEFKKNKQRWEASDNLMVLGDSLGDSIVFVSHGTEDFVCSFDQSIMLGIKLNQVRKKSSSMGYKFLEQKNKMHDWPTFNAASYDFIKFIGK